MIPAGMKVEEKDIDFIFFFGLGGILGFGSGNGKKCSKLSVVVLCALMQKFYVNEILSIIVLQVIVFSLPFIVSSFFSSLLFFRFLYILYFIYQRSD